MISSTSGREGEERLDGLVVDAVDVGHGVAPRLALGGQIVEVGEELEPIAVVELQPGLEVRVHALELVAELEDGLDRLARRGGVLDQVPGVLDDAAAELRAPAGERAAGRHRARRVRCGRGARSTSCERPPRLRGLGCTGWCGVRSDRPRLVERRGAREPALAQPGGDPCLSAWSSSRIRGQALLVAGAEEDEGEGTEVEVDEAPAVGRDEVVVALRRRPGEDLELAGVEADLAVERRARGRRRPRRWAAGCGSGRTRR